MDESRNPIDNGNSYSNGNDSDNGNNNDFRSKSHDMTSMMRQIL